MFKNLKNNIHLYEIFYTVAKTKNISKAAEFLFISQPAVSYHLRVLERQLGIKLFYRTPKGVVLTPGGETFLPYVEAGYQSLVMGERAIDEIDSFNTGKITIGAPSHICMFYLMKKIKDFNKKYPNIQINIQNKSTAGLVSLANSNAIDLFVDSMPINVGDKNTVIEHLSDERCCFACHRDYYLKYNVGNDILKLNDFDLILPEEESSNRNMIDNFFLGYSVILRPKFQATTTEVMTWFVRNKLGIGFFFEKSINEYLEKGEFIKLNFKEQLPTIELVVGYNKFAQTKIAEKFLCFLTKQK